MFGSCFRTLAAILVSLFFFLLLTQREGFSRSAGVCSTILSHPPPHSATLPAGVCGTMPPAHPPLTVPHCQLVSVVPCPPPTRPSQCHTASWCLWYHALPTPSLLTVPHSQLVSVVPCSPHPLPPHSATQSAGVCGTMLFPPPPSSQCHTASWCQQYVPCVTVPHSQLVSAVRTVCHSATQPAGVSSTYRVSQCHTASWCQQYVPCVTVPHSQLVYAVPCSRPLPPPLPQVPHGQLANCGCEWPRTSGQKGLIRLNQGVVTPRRRQ